MGSTSSNVVLPGDTAGRAALAREVGGFHEFAKAQVYHRLDLRNAIFHRGNPGSATFVGFASQWEARLALEEARVRVPATLAGGTHGY